MMSQDGVQVQVGVGQHEGKTKSTEVQPAGAGACSSSACSTEAWSGKCLWAIFLLGWVFPPAWWAGVAGGLRCGKDDEYLFKRRTFKTTSASIAWAGNLLMTLVTPVVLVLVLSIFYGRPGPAQDGECLSGWVCEWVDALAGLCIHAVDSVVSNSSSGGTAVSARQMLGAVHAGNHQGLLERIPSWHLTD